MCFVNSIIIMGKKIRLRINNNKSYFHYTVFLLFFFIFISSANRNFAQKNLPADNLCGEWWTPENQGRIIFFKDGTTYSGKVSWFKVPNDPETGKPKLDKHNPNPALRKRPVMGLVLFYNFKYDPSKNKYVDGKLYDSEHGKTYSCWIKLTSHNVLELHGYVGFSLIGKSVYFTRVQK